MSEKQNRPEYDGVIKLMYLHTKGGRALLAFKFVNWTLEGRGGPFKKIEGEPVDFETYLALKKTYTNLEFANITDFVMSEIVGITLADWLDEDKQKKLGL
jgi:hypothetical protein